MRLGVFPGSFNPPTNAHVALMEAAARHVDAVRAVLPRTFPHKIYHGATLEQRIEMLQAIDLPVPFSVGVTQGGLFIEIARECRESFGADADLWFLCGRDAAERILEWDYGEAHRLDDMLQEFGLLVADRRGEFEPPERFAGRIQRLTVPRSIDEVSSTEVRTRIERAEPWSHLVPRAVVPIVARVYQR